MNVTGNKCSNYNIVSKKQDYMLLVLMPATTNLIIAVHLSIGIVFYCDLWYC